MEHDIVVNLNHVRRRIATACAASGRNVADIKLLLATKTVDAARIQIALQAGANLIAENKVQELKEKFEELKETPHEKHFIGHLQSNKIKDVLKYGITCIQSVDNLDLARKIARRMSASGKTMEILVQVNTSGEQSKFGVAPCDAIQLVRDIAELPSLRINGLMTIGLFSAETALVRECFRLLKTLQSAIIVENIPGVAMTELSMGMSGDLETAIAEGATIVRVGTAIFGERVYPDSYYWKE